MDPTDNCLVAEIQGCGARIAGYLLSSILGNGGERWRFTCGIWKLNKHGIGLTEAVKMAVRSQLRREQEAIPLRDRIAVLRREVLKRPVTGLEADKAFFDDLSGEP